MSTVALAQSDCYAPNCGTMPLLNFSNENGGVTDLYLHYDSDCDVYFRTRFSPIEGPQPPPNFYVVYPGQNQFYFSDIMATWSDYTGKGTFILDWGTYDCEPDVRTAGIYRKSEVFGDNPPIFYNINKPRKLEPGCHIFIISPGTDFRISVYNESDYSTQTVKYGGVFHLSLPGETLVISDEWSEKYVELCMGEIPPGPSLPGLDTDLPLYIEGLSRAVEGDVHKIINLK